MASSKGKTSSGAKIPVERPDREAAERDPGEDAVDRPGFDLGGAKNRGASGKMRNPPTDPDLGSSGTEGTGGRPSPGARGAPGSGAGAGRRGKTD